MLFVVILVDSSINKRAAQIFKGPFKDDPNQLIDRSLIKYLLIDIPEYFSFC